MDRAAFENRLASLIANAYDASELADRPQPEHSWVTGYLGEPFSPVWFIAENPSLRQVEKITDPDPSPERQRTMTKGVGLFRDALCTAGFKDGASMDPGGWRCYITDVIKSAAVVKEFSSVKASERWELACARAPVLAWELSCGQPKIIVFVGARARQYTQRLIRQARLPDPQREWNARFKEVPHYVYVTQRPDNRRKLRANDQLRRDEFIAEFGRIAAERDALHAELRTTDGARASLGTYKEVERERAALNSIFEAGSAMGRFSNLVWWLHEPLDAPVFDQLGHRPRPGVAALLHRLRELGSELQPPSR